VIDFQKDLVSLAVIVAGSFLAGYLLGGADERRASLDRDLDRLVGSGQHSEG
jgi:hypothetical protein